MAVGMQRVQKEFVLKNLLENGIRLSAHLGDRRTEAKLIDYDRSTLVLEPAQPAVFRGRNTVNVYFSMGGHMMTFKSRVKSLEEGKVTVLNPDFIYRRLERAYERIAPEDDVAVRVFLSGDALQLDFPESKGFDPVDESIRLGVQFDPERIASLMKSFRERASSIAAESKIVMFRSRRPSGLPEELIALTGKILLLPMEAARTLEGNAIADRVLTEEEVMAALTDAGQEVFFASGRLQDEHLRIQRSGITAELYCPVLFRHYAVGYIYLLQGQTGKPFSPATVDFVRQFSRVLAYALNANGYFEGSAKPRSRDAELIDISASGVLFALREVQDRVHEYDELELSVDFPDRTIETRGRAMRMYTSEDATYVGVQFTSMDDDDAHYLMTRLYGENYTGSIDVTAAGDPDRNEGNG